MTMPPEGSGVKLGSATAVVRLATEAFAQSRKIIQSESVLVGKAVESIGAKASQLSKDTQQSMRGVATAFDNAKKAAREFDKTPLGAINTNLNEIRNTVLATTAVFGGLAAAGLKTANDLKRTTVSLELLSGSQKKAKDIMGDVRKLSQQFGTPYTQLLEGARAFLPLAKTTGADLNELLVTALKFQAYNPAKNFGDVKFSINEAISGDFTSIRDALDLSRKQRDDLKAIFEKEGASGVINEINQILDSRGIDAKTLEAMGKSGVNAFENMGDAAKEALGTAFEPLLNNVIVPALQAFTQFLVDLNTNNPALLQFAGGMTAIVAGVGSAVLAVTALTNAMKALKVASAFAGSFDAIKGIASKAGGLAKGALVTAGSLEVGNRLGLGLVNTLAGAGAQGGTFERIRKGEAAGDVIGETGKQLLVIVVKLITDGLLGVIRILVDAFSNLGKVVKFLEDGFTLFGTFLIEFIGNLQTAVGDILTGIANNLSGLFDTTDLRNAGKANQDMGQSNIIASQQSRAEVLGRLSKGIVFDGNAGNDFMKQATEAQNNLLKGFTEMLFPVKQNADDTADSLEGASEALKAVGDSAEYLTKQREEIVDAVTQYNEDVKKIEDDKQKDILALNTKYADDQIKIAQDAVDASTKALEQLLEARQKLEVDFTRDNDKASRELQRDILDKQIEAQRKEKEDYQGHLDKLTDIRKKAQEKEQDLLMNLDFKGLFQASQDKKRAIDAENDAFIKQREAKSENLNYELDDLQRNAQAQREERMIQYQLSMSDLQANYNKEMVQIQRQRDQKLALAEQAHRNDLAQLQNKYTNELNMRRQAVQQELQFLSLSEAQRAKILQDSQTKIIAQAQSLLNTLTTVKGVSTAKPIVAPTTTTIKPTSTVFSGGNNTRTIATRALGGTLREGQLSFVNELMGQAERYQTGNRTYALDGGAGLFMPFQSGKIEPSGGNQAPQITVSVSGNSFGANMNENTLASLISQKVADTLADWTS